jgi:ribosome-associated protein YbcJ (S4-like RNA binding protein)
MMTMNLTTLIRGCKAHHSGHAAKLAIAEVYPQDTPADDL